MKVLSIFFAFCLYQVGIRSLAIDGPLISVNTQNLTVFNLTQIFDQNSHHELSVECHNIRDRPDLPNFHEDSCFHGIAFACHKLTYYEPQYLVRDRWIWTNLPGCSLAFYVPVGAAIRRLPTVEECQVDIFNNLIERCVVSSRWNLGTMNVFDPPTPNGPGAAFLRNLPRYLVAPAQLDVRR